MAQHPQHDPTLDDAWASAVTAQLALPAPHFAPLQPACPVPPDDAGLWSLLGALPVAPAGTAITPSTVSFFAEYAAMAMAAVRVPSTFEQDIGETVYGDWTAYLQDIQPQPTPAELPLLFERWAMMNAPAVAQVGTSDLARAALDGKALDALRPYLGATAQTPDYSPDAVALAETLAAAPTAGVVLKNFTSRAGFGHNAGLWSGSPASSRLARRFAAGAVTVTASFRFAVAAITPGAWYSSGLVNVLRSAQGSPPWPDDGSACWDDFFGPQGSLRQVMVAMAFMDEARLSVASSTIFGEADQAEIRDAAPLGLWPFYLPAGDAVQYDLCFDADGALHYTMTTPSGLPLGLGATLLPPG